MYICDYDCLVLGLVGVLVWLVLFGYLLLGLVVVDVWLGWVVCCLCLFGFSVIVVVCERLVGCGVCYLPRSRCSLSGSAYCGLRASCVGCFDGKWVLGFPGLWFFGLCG